MQHQSPTRSPRKRVQVPVRYRVGAETRWHSGTTENLSLTGALIRTESPVPEAARLQLVLAVPPRVLDTAPCELACVGLVRRLARSERGEHVVGIQFAQVALDALDTVIARV